MEEKKRNKVKMVAWTALGVTLGVMAHQVLIGAAIGAALGLYFSKDDKEDD
jgi:hypothetical protein